MELIYKNNYGACYNVIDAPNPKCVLQLIVDGVGIFMAKKDLKNLLTIVSQKQHPLTTTDHQIDKCNKIFCSGESLDFYLKVRPLTIALLEDLIRGTLFIMEMDKTLDKHRIK